MLLFYYAFQFIVQDYFLIQMMYQRGGSGIPQQHTGRKASTDSKTQEKLVKGTICQTTEKKNEGIALKPDMNPMHANFQGPFGVGINQQDRPNQRNEEISKIPFMANSNRFSIPESLGTNELSKTHSTASDVSATFTPVRSEQQDIKNTTKEYYLHSNTAMNQQLKQIHSECRQLPIDNIQPQDSNSNDYVRTYSLHQKSTTASSGLQFPHNLGQQKSTESSGSGLGSFTATSGNQRRSIGIGVQNCDPKVEPNSRNHPRMDQISEENSNSKTGSKTNSKANSRYSLKSKRAYEIPVINTSPNQTPSFLVEHDSHRERSPAEPSEVVKLKQDQSGLIGSLSSTFEKGTAAMPLDFDLPINKRGIDRLLKPNTTKKPSSQRNILPSPELLNQKSQDRATSEENQQKQIKSQSNESGRLETDQSNDLTQTISNDSFAHSQYNKAIQSSDRGKAVISTKELQGKSRGMDDITTTLIVPSVPGSIEKKNFSDPVEKKSPERQRNRDDQEVEVSHPVKSPKETCKDDSESLLSQSISAHSRVQKFQNEECTFGKAANLAAKIEHTFGRRNELQQKIDATFGRGADLKQQIQQTFGKGGGLASKIANEINIRKQLKQVEQQQKNLAENELQSSGRSSVLDTTPQTISSQKYEADSEAFQASDKIERRQHTAQHLAIKPKTSRKMDSGDSVGEKLMQKTDPNVSQLGGFNFKHKDFFHLEKSILNMNRNSDSGSSRGAAYNAQKNLDEEAELRDSVPEQSATFDQTEFLTKQTSSVYDIINSGQRRSDDAQSHYSQFVSSKSLSPTKFQKHNSAVSQYGEMSPSLRHTNVLEFVPVQRRHSARSQEKQQIIQVIDKGRSPRVPFVSGIRNSIKRTTKVHRRQNSPPEKVIGKDVSSSLIETSQEEIYSKISSSNTTAKPQDLLKKYQNYKTNSLKLSVYKDMTLRIFQTINIIKQIEVFPRTPEVFRIDFQFKKKGFDKLIIFDLDETLIHTKRDEDDVDDVEYLVELYGEGFVNMEPDMVVEMTPPDTDQLVIQSGFFIRPYVYDLLRVANLDYEVAVFTAGYDWYANPILDILDPSGELIQHRFFRQNCQRITHMDKELIIKDLSVFKNIDLDKVLIVDNAVFSFASHLSNGIPVVDFLGQKGDQELIKVMKYIHEISKEDNLRAANEQMFQLKKILDSGIDKFIKYYSIDELSESDDNDFEDDGVTVIGVQINPPTGIGTKDVGYGSKDEFQNSNTSPRDNASQFGDSTEMKLNQSIGNSGIDEAQTPTEDLLKNMRKLSTQKLKDKIMKSKIDKQNVLVVNQMRKQNKTNSSISSYSGGNNIEQVIVDQQSSVASPLQNGGQNEQAQSAHGVSEDDKEDTPGIQLFSQREALMEEEKDLQLRRKSNLQKKSPGKIDTRLWKDKTSSFGRSHQELATSPYFKVSQTTLSMNQIWKTSLEGSIRQSTDSQNQYYTPANLPKNGPLKSMIKNSSSNLSLTAYSASRVGRPPLPSSQTNFGNTLKVQQPVKLSHANQSQQGINNGSDTKTNSLNNTLGNQYEDEESLHINTGMVGETSALELGGSMGSPPNTNTIGMNDTFNNDQKKQKNSTFTSVKKNQKLSKSDLLTPSEQQQLQNQIHTNDVYSIEHPYRDISSFTNILKPPNWTKRKQSLMQRFKSTESPSCASNINYHLDKLASCYKQSQGELMEVLMKQNPNNRRFTPSSKMGTEKSQSADIQSKFSLPQSVGRHPQGANQATAAAQVRSTGRRMGVGEGLKRLTEKYQAGQICDGQSAGAPTLNVCQQDSDQPKAGSHSVPKKRSNPKILKESCTFGSGELALQPELQHQQSDESQTKKEKMLLTEPTDELGTVSRIKSELTFQPTDVELSRKVMTTTDSHRNIPTDKSERSPFDEDFSLNKLINLQKIDQVPSQKEGTDSSGQEETPVASVTPEEPKQQAVNQQAGETKLRRRKTKVILTLAPLADYVNISNRASNQHDSSLE